MIPSSISVLFRVYEIFLINTVNDLHKVNSGLGHSIKTKIIFKFGHYLFLIGLDAWVFLALKIGNLNTHTHLQ